MGPGFFVHLRSTDLGEKTGSQYFVRQRISCFVRTLLSLVSYKSRIQIVGRNSQSAHSQVQPVLRLLLVSRISCRLVSLIANGLPTLLLPSHQGEALHFMYVPESPSFVSPYGKH